MTAGNPAEYRMRYQKGGISGRIYCTLTVSSFKYLASQSLTTGKCNAERFYYEFLENSQTRYSVPVGIRLDRKYGARPAGRPDTDTNR